MVDKPLKIVSEHEDPARCVLELTGRLDIRACAASPANAFSASASTSSSSSSSSPTSASGLLFDTSREADQSSEFSPVNHVFLYGLTVRRPRKMTTTTACITVNGRSLLSVRI